MKKLIFILVFIPCISFSQNMVINGSFENIDTCVFPNCLNIPGYWNSVGDTIVNICYPWKNTFPNAALTPDIFTNCFGVTNDSVGGLYDYIPWVIPPYTYNGYRFPRTGNNMFGHFIILGSSNPDFICEYFTGEILPLDSGRTYKLSFWIAHRQSNHLWPMYHPSSALKGQKMPVNPHTMKEIGCFLTDTAINLPVLNIKLYMTSIYQWQIKNTTHLMDSMNWMKIEGTFVATGNENYLTPGVYESKMMMDTIKFQNPINNYDKSLYYYYEDFSLYPADTIPPVSIAGNDTMICYGDTICLGSHNYNDYDYVWFTKNQTAINNAPFIEKFNIQHLLLNGFAPYKKQLNFISNIGIISQIPLVTTTYYCLATDFTYEKTLDSVTVYVKKCGTNAGMDTTVCKESNIILGDSSNIGYQCQWQPSTYLSSDTVPMPQMSCMSSMTYYLTVYSGSVIIKTDSIKVIVGDCYYAEAGIDTTLCLGDSMQLGSHNHSSCTYVWWPNQWLSDSTTGMPFAKPDTLIKYFLQVIDTLGNVSVDSILIGVIDCDTVGIDASTPLSVWRIRVYPNPASGIIIIEFGEVLHQEGVIEIYDNIGRKVMETVLKQGENKYQITTKKLESGIYFYKLQAAQSYNGKIIISK